MGGGRPRPPTQGFPESQRKTTKAGAEAPALSALHDCLLARTFLRRNPTHADRVPLQDAFDLHALSRQSGQFVFVPIQRIALVSVHQDETRTFLHTCLGTLRCAFSRVPEMASPATRIRNHAGHRRSVHLLLGGGSRGRSRFFISGDNGFRSQGMTNSESHGRAGNKNG